jgi:hypothetical protein
MSGFSNSKKLKGGDYQKEYKDEIPKNSEGKMVSFIRDGRRYFTTRIEAERARRKGQTIRYSTRHNAYYIVDIKSGGWWVW